MRVANFIAIRYAGCEGVLSSQLWVLVLTNCSWTYHISRVPHHVIKSLLDSVQPVNKRYQNKQKKRVVSENEKRKVTLPRDTVESLIAESKKCKVIPTGSLHLLLE